MVFTVSNLGATCTKPQHHISINNKYNYNDIRTYHYIVYICACSNSVQRAQRTNQQKGNDSRLQRSIAAWSNKRSKYVWQTHDGFVCRWLLKRYSVTAKVRSGSSVFKDGGGEGAISQIGRGGGEEPGGCRLCGNRVTCLACYDICQRLITICGQLISRFSGCSG